MTFNVEIQKEWFSVEQCNANPDKLYVFGDNLEKVGKGGQAIIRGVENSYGIATKRLPTMSEKAFFSDQSDEAKAIFIDVYGLCNTYNYYGYESIVLPYMKLGTGLSKMPEKSPKLYKWLNDTLSLMLDIDYNYEP